MTLTGTEANVCADIAARQQKGIIKYGATVAENSADLRAWLQHAYEECLDQAVYLRRAIEELDKERVSQPTALLPKRDVVVTSELIHTLGEDGYESWLREMTALEGEVTIPAVHKSKAVLGEEAALLPITELVHSLIPDGSHS